MSSVRTQRVRELLKRTLGEIIRRELPLGEAGLITVNEVAVAGDLRSAQVMIGIVGNAQQKKNAAALLQREGKRLQGLLAREVVLKWTPQLRFVLDDSIEQGNKVIQMLEELEKNPPGQPDAGGHQ